MSAIIPLPKDELNIRFATMGDLAFIDALQKEQSKSLGFLQLKALEGKIAAEQVLIADVDDQPVGYCIGQDRYYKRDDVGIIFQMNIVPGKQRGFVATALLKAQFDRSAYGCRLYCCWCAQDLEANRFWEAMGFVPLAFRAGSDKKKRVHIFWEKKIRGNDDTCHWWYPHKTDQGAMRADRLAFPIPPGTHWSEVKAVVLPGQSEETKQLPRERTKKDKLKPLTASGKPVIFGSPDDEPPIITAQKPAPAVEKPKRTPKPKVKIDPKYVAASREFRDRYLEEVNERGFKLESAGKYELTRQVVESPLPNSLPPVSVKNGRARGQEKKLLAA